MTKPEHSYPYYPVLIVDDEELFALSEESQLRAFGINHIQSCRLGQELKNLLAGQEAACILLDLSLPDIPGQELLVWLKENHPPIPVIVVTASSKIEMAVECMKLGAYDYLTKPLAPPLFQSVIKRVLAASELQRERDNLRERFFLQQLEQPAAFDSIITKNKEMFTVFEYIEAIRFSSEAVLISGETGTGKELIAQAIHKLSGRQGAFVAVNTAGLDKELFADALFGHQPGSFTGAEKKREGLIEQAKGGTLFLDEIGDLTLEVQKKLLRVLEMKEYLPLGADRPRLCEARIVTATNAALKELVKNGQFRNDLYYRLTVHQLHIPSLKARQEDIPLLVRHFIEQSCREYRKPVPAVPPELYTLLSTYSFPGNIRELRNMVYDAVSRHKGTTLSLTAFNTRIFDKGGQENSPAGKEGSTTKNMTNKIHFPEILPSLTEMKRELILEALERAQGSQALAARLLDVSPQVLNYWVSKHRPAL